MRSFSLPEPYTVPKYCSFQESVQSRCCRSLASQSWSISQVWGTIFKTSRLCLCPLPVGLGLLCLGRNRKGCLTEYLDSNFPFPTPDWLVTNKTWYDEELAVYYKNRTGKLGSACHGYFDQLTPMSQGPFTITWFSGSIVAFLPLQNITQNYKSIIKTAAAVDLASLLPKNTDHTILAGYKAQRDLILQLYASPHATAQEVAFGGGNTVPVVVLKPLSRGSITINTTDPTAPPVFDYGTFSHPTDLEIAVQAIKKTRQWMRSAPMQEIGAVESYPGTNITSDEDIAASIRTFARSTWAHPSGTLSMMKREYGGVVDSQLQVYGVKGLRVVDASIMPLIPGTHTSSTVYAVAEKVCLSLFVVHHFLCESRLSNADFGRWQAADLIKAAYKHK